jgi:hypothetical protein
LCSALGMRDGEPPPFLWRMRANGYPPAFLTPPPDTRGADSLQLEAAGALPVPTQAVASTRRQCPTEEGEVLEEELPPQPPPPPLTPPPPPSHDEIARQDDVVPIAEAASKKTARIQVQCKCGWVRAARIPGLNAPGVVPSAAAVPSSWPAAESELPHAHPSRSPPITRWRSLRDVQGVLSGPPLTHRVRALTRAVRRRGCGCPRASCTPR